MSGQVLHDPVDAHGVMRVRLCNPGKHNAISVAMWEQLGRLFERLQEMPADEAPRALLVAGDGGHFAAGADIEEFPQFRFDETALRGYHEDVVAPALGAPLACDIPLVAQIDGSCVGATTSSW